MVGPIEPEAVDLLCQRKAEYVEKWCSGGYPSRNSKEGERTKFDVFTIGR